MEPYLAGGTPLEVLDDVGHVDLVAVDLRVLQRTVEQLPRGPDEWLTFTIFMVGRLLADEHDPSIGRAFARSTRGCSRAPTS